jgi:hypothetical protein
MKLITKRGIKILIWILVAILILGFLAYFGVYKPAVYLYPNEDSQIQVKLKVNGFITNDIPKYNNGWDVFVKRGGLIENKYDYLFYEAKLRKLELPDNGWIVSYDKLDNWFDTELIQLGLNEKEKNQFKEYWLNKLPKANYYEIRILEDSFLKDNMDLIVSPKPDTVIRLNLFFRAHKEEIDIKEPDIITPERKGFTVVEWGGILYSPFNIFNPIKINSN